jgi:hypothetical protein
MRKWTSITLKKSTIKKLKKLKLIKTESLGSVVERLIKEYEKNRKKEVK